MDYKKRIADIVNKIQSERRLRNIYIFVKTILESEEESLCQCANTDKDM